MPLMHPLAGARFWALPLAWLWVRVQQWSAGRLGPLFTAATGPWGTGLFQPQSTPMDLSRTASRYEWCQHCTTAADQQHASACISMQGACALLDMNKTWLAHLEHWCNGPIAQTHALLHSSTI